MSSVQVISEKNELNMFVFYVEGEIFGELMLSDEL